MATGRYKKPNDAWDTGSNSPRTGANKYSEDTPSFESLKSGNAGQGTRGISNYSVGKADNAENRLRAQFEHEKEAGGAGTDRGFSYWKKL